MDARLHTPENVKLWLPPRQSRGISHVALARIVGFEMIGHRIILWFALTMLTAPCYAAELSAGSTPHYSFDFAERDSGIENYSKINPLAVDQYRNTFQKKFDLKKESPFAEGKNTDNSDFFWSKIWVELFFFNPNAIEWHFRSEDQ